MKPSLVLLVRLLAFVAGSRLCSFILGINRAPTADPLPIPTDLIEPIFGLVVLLWHSKSVRQVVSQRSLAFLAASTFVWMIVQRLPIPPALRGDYGLGGLVMIVATGTFLLPIAHALILGTSWWRVALAIPGIFGVWWYLTLSQFRFEWIVDVWQGLYLLFMFVSIPASERSPAALRRLRRSGMEHGREWRSEAHQL